MRQEDPMLGRGEEAGSRDRGPSWTTRLSPRSRKGVVALIAMLALSSPLAAHVTLGSPNGGEMLIAGDAVTIEWVLAIQHNTQNWDLWYSTTGDGGPWLVIASDLPLGNPDQGSVHTFVWTVPDDPSDHVRVRVRQDNMGIDYEDISDADLSIEAGVVFEGFEDDFETGDLSAWTIVVP